MEDKPYNYLKVKQYFIDKGEMKRDINDRIQKERENVIEEPEEEYNPTIAGEYNYLEVKKRLKID
jgi:hypothetical protein